MGFDDGRVRIIKFKFNDTLDLSDYIEYSIHDKKRGRIKNLCFCKDNGMLFTYGDDGNIFSFVLQCNDKVNEKCMSSTFKLPKSLIYSVSFNKM